MELVTVSPSTPIEWLHEVPVYRLRGQLLPLVWLDQLLGLAELSLPSSRPPSEAGQKLHVAVMKVDQLRYGLVIDEVLNSQEIVVKPIGASIKSIGAYSAATILGDGSVALILDVGGIARLADLVRDETGKAAVARGAGQVDALARTEADDSDRQPDQEGRSLLVCDITVDRQVGIPMEWVERLEELPRSQLQQLETGLVASYRGGILPIQVLVDGPPPIPATGRKSEAAMEPTVQIVVCSKENHRVGVLVERVLDIVPCAEVVGSAGGEDAGPFEAGLRTDQMTLVQGRVLEVMNFENMMTGAR
jgi:two-component system chemotaxis sensor kinase CheA